MPDERKPMANIAPFGLRMQPDLKARMEESARENNRSLNAEIVARLENSIEDLDGYKELADLFIEVMKDNADTARREVEEYRQMVTTIKLMRHTIDRLVDQIGDDIPEDLKTLLGFLSPRSTARADDPVALMTNLHEAMERHDKLVEEQDASPKAGRRDRIRQIMERLDRRISGQ